MKIITCPADIKPETSVFQKETDFPFKAFLTTAMDRYEPSGRSASMIRQAIKIMDAVEAGNGTIALEDDHYKTLHAAIEACNWNPPLARQIVPYFEAVEKAEEVKTPK